MNFNEYMAAEIHKTQKKIDSLSEIIKSTDSPAEISAAMNELCVYQYFIKTLQTATAKHKEEVK